ncbi:MAG: hypothetical protein RLZZ292_140 [Bacteroidota bacterium]
MLEIRKNYFGNAILTANSIYENLLIKNQFAYKIVSVESEIIGYWSIIPINENTFKKFISAKSSHTEVIESSISWNDIGNNVFLYIVGIVVNTKQIGELPPLK